MGIPSYSAERTAQPGTPSLIHQPSYSMLNRWIEPDLLDTVDRPGVGTIVFSPPPQGLLTGRVLVLLQTSDAALTCCDIASLDALLSSPGTMGDAEAERWGRLVRTLRESFVPAWLCWARRCSNIVVADGRRAGRVGT